MANLVSEERISRFHDIYKEFKRYHWWLTGPHDLTACAVLAEMPGDPVSVGRHVEEIYQGLRHEGFKTSIHLETAAHILMLADIPAATIISRYRELSRRFTAAGEQKGMIGYDAVAVMSLLDVPVERVVQTAIGTRRELRQIHPTLHDQVELDVTADLTFLSLVDSDNRLASPSHETRHRIVTAGMQAAAIVACFGAIALDPNIC